MRQFLLFLLQRRSSVAIRSLDTAVSKFRGQQKITGLGVNILALLSGKRLATTRRDFHDNREIWT